MDIMRPPLEQQVSPAPWFAIRNNVNAPSLIARVLVQSPDASANDIVNQLRDWGVQVSGIIVSMWLLRWKEHLAAMSTADEPESNRQNGQSPQAELSCRCDEQPCTCGKSRSPRWQHYYCGIRLTASQANALDEFFKYLVTP
jgi:hypothetical protein